MGKPKRTLPGPIASAVTCFLRGLLSVPLIAGTWPSAMAGEAFGRWFGSMPFNRKRFARALEHLRIAFPDWEEDRRRACAESAYGHLFRLAVEFAFTPRLFSNDNWPSHLEVSGVAAGRLPERTMRALAEAGLLPPRDASALGHIGPALDLLLEGRPCVMVTGHCGNWEVLGYALAMLGFPMYALYRPLDNPVLDRWVRAERQRHGLVLLDKFGAVERMPGILARGEPVAFVADQNAGDRGLFVPYFGRLASTYKSIGLMAMRFDAPLIVGMAKRTVGPEGGERVKGFRYHVYVADVIRPEDWKAQPDPLFYLTARYRRAIETMVRTAPEQYLWMHRMWKSRPRHERVGRPVPAALAEKIRSLPWLSADEAAAVIERSNRESAERTEGVMR